MDAAFGATQDTKHRSHCQGVRTILKIFLSWMSFLPTSGGPAVSVSHLAKNLAEVGASVGLWAPDGSAVLSTLAPSQSALRFFDGSAHDALKRFGRPDIIHDNGIWMPHNHALARVAARQNILRLVSLRGMIEPWAINYKKWKKMIAWELYQRRDLARAHLHHATSEAEANHAKRYKLGVPISVIPNGVDIPENCDESGASGERGFGKGWKKTALFLGRIHPVKGLPLLIDAWARVRPHGWQLQIAGPDEIGHRRDIKKLVCARNLSDVVTFAGQLDHGGKQFAYFKSDLFILPSHSENFGMVVAEALAHGVPVITTTGTPWSMLQERRCGWWVDATVDGIAAAVRDATSCDIQTLREMGIRGREWVQCEFGWDRIARKFLDTYQALTAGRYGTDAL